MISDAQNILNRIASEMTKTIKKEPVEEAHKPIVNDRLSMNESTVDSYVKYLDRLRGI